MNISTLVVKTLITGAVFAASLAQATILTLPAPNVMSVSVYNDFDVYSLDLLKKCAAGGDIRCMPTVGVPVQSSPGIIADDVVVLQSADGHSNFPSPFAPGALADDRFLTPTGNQSSSYVMSDPGSGSFGAGDQVDRWDISLDLLKTYLDGHDLVFLFDNNQEGNKNGQIVFLWGQARIVDANGNTVGNHCYEINFNGTGGCSDSSADPVASDHVPVATDFCVDKLSGASYNIGLAGNANDCPVEAGHTAGGYRINNNLSTSVAEFAAFNRQLHDAAMDAANSGYFLSLNIEYFSNDAGAEQLWICSTCDISTRTNVPEPSSLPLVLMGLLAGGFSLVRSRRA
jgi:hypothetical protein